MKINNSRGPVVNLPQSKLAREKKATEKNGDNDTLSDSVELRPQESSVKTASVSSQVEALEVAGNIDYSKAIDAHFLSGDASSRLLSLI